MQRITLKERPDWRGRVEELGFVFHSDGGPYWTDDVAYGFTIEQIEQIEEAVGNIESMILSVVADAVNDPETLDLLAIPRDFHSMVRRSWQAREKNLFCRYDLSYDGVSPPKLLEANADTPTSLPEAAVIQWTWLEEQVARGQLPGGSDQFNSLHERLVDAWRRMDVRGTLTLAGVLDMPEDHVNLLYMADCASQAGIKCHLMDIDQIGLMSDGRFCDDDDGPIDTLFKLHPWEYLARSSYGPNLIDPNARVRVIEPAWKMIVSNKGLLPLLWEAFPYHPNLLGACFETNQSRSIGWGREPGQPMVRKPLLSREGANIEIVGKAAATEGPYGTEGHILQQYAPLPEYDGRYPVIGAWTIAGEPAGMGIRESDSLITTNTSRFVPHFMT
jgi:glutathionylspermidine synthase